MDTKLSKEQVEYLLDKLHTDIKVETWKSSLGQEAILTGIRLSKEYLLNAISQKG